MLCHWSLTVKFYFVVVWVNSEVHQKILENLVLLSVGKHYENTDFIINTCPQCQNSFQMICYYSTEIAAK